MKKTLIFVAILAVALVGVYLFTNTDGNNELDSQTVNLYYYNPDLDTDKQGNILCSEEGLVAVERELENNENPVSDTISLLLEGNVTESEANQGIETEFPLDGFSLASSTLKNGTLSLTFNDPNFASSGGTCRTTILSSQVRYTAEQFEEVEELQISPDHVFQP